MKRQVEVRRTHVSCFDGSHKMVFAMVTDNVNNLKYEIHEWLDHNMHVDREESDLYYKYMEARLDLSIVKDVFDEVDAQLDKH